MYVMAVRIVAFGYCPRAG